MPDDIAAAVIEGEHLNLRRLPKVEHVDAPARFSQTLLRHGNTCKRAAYLYVRHHGGMPAHELDRGTALHIAQAKATNLILERYVIDAGGEGDVDYGIDEYTAKLLLEETFDEHPELTIPLHERDQLRMMMSHLANGWKVSPSQIVGVERKFVIELGEFRVSCVLDLALIDGRTAHVWDYKTSWDMPSQADYDATFQGRLYAVALIYGHPVTEVPCEACPLASGVVSDCEVCGGRGYTERLEQPLGEHLEVVTVGEVFPRFLQEDGAVATRSMPLVRIEVEALRRDVEDQCAQLKQAFETDEFPAVSGSHCKRCPCEPECPLPRHLRNYQGTIQTEAEAREAAEWWQRNVEALDATRKEIRSFVKIHGPLRFGADQLFEFGQVMRWRTDWDSIEAGALRAAHYGEPFDLGDHRRQTLATEFKARKLTEAELVAEREERS